MLATDWENFPAGSTLNGMEKKVFVREVHFSGPHELHDQAPAALRWLVDSPLIIACEIAGLNRLRVEYDLREITFVEIESALQELGFHLDNSLFSKLRRAFHAYCDGTCRANMQIDPHCIGNCARRIFVKQYQRGEHGCRDTRPRHWREYL
jgi:hypothetical protein